MSDIELIGVDALRAALRNLSTYKMKRAIRRGSQAGNTLIYAMAKRTIPEVTRKDRYGLETKGQLRASLTIRPIPANRKGWIGTRVSVKEDGLEYKGDVFYGAFVEYGTKNMQKRAYLKKATDARSAAAIRIAKEVIVREIAR